MNIDWNPSAGKLETRVKDAEGGLTRGEILARGESLNSDAVRFHVFPTSDRGGPLGRPDLQAHADAFAQYPGMVLTRLYFDPTRARYCGVYEKEKLAYSGAVREAA